ncbi:hypothetical protein MPTK1_6g13860 [Marchantia polymorpha subsp. ruderalis]|uniref:Uncharacterized protein n=2 Tax=Marchantia polymorpha TaxID=3197 RepID=A0AAF6BRT2_MARPO|nr:hypothetical protein MARPO_0047s0038 [Marchantia polymorpha]BBN14716.1 hypothetical protein Mp_6g13860 [Marchantia polymorpha subsp. ruderalis]|eukprot:PTQ39055.1 hypothetical protein MARPO_0047s0038 [Marchantia polymorpha]
MDRHIQPVSSLEKKTNWRSVHANCSTKTGQLGISTEKLVEAIHQPSQVTVSSEPLKYRRRRPTRISTRWEPLLLLLLGPQIQASPDPASCSYFGVIRPKNANGGECCDSWTQVRLGRLM